MKNRVLAAIDMGTNSFHLIIVELQKSGSFKIIDRERIVIRLGSSSKGTTLNFISPKEFDKARIALQQFKRLAQFYNAEIIAIATSAVREASNQKDFINFVYAETGIKVQVIEGKKEAYLIFSGISKALDINNSKVLCADIGGGSTEIIYAVNNNIVFSDSIKVGAMRLSKMFFPNFEISESSVNECKEYVVEEIKKKVDFSLIKEIDFSVFTSGTANASANIVNYEKNKTLIKDINGYEFSDLELKSVYDKVIAAKTFEQRKLIGGMEERRADIIPGGIIILDTIRELFNLKRFKISEYAMREGIILNNNLYI